MKKSIVVFFLAVVMIFVSSCSRGDELGRNAYPQVSHLVFSDNSTGWKYADKNQHYGICDLNGNVIVNAIYENMPTYIFDGYFFVIPNGETEYALYNIKDVNTPIARGYSSVLPFTEETTFVTKKNCTEVYHIDKTGKELKKLDLQDVSSIEFVSDGVAVFKDSNEKYGILSLKDYSLSTKRFDACSFFANGIALAREGNKIDYINKNGESILTYSTNEHGGIAEYYASFSPEWLPYVDENTETMGVKNINGETVIKSGKYKKIDFMCDGYAVATDGEKWCLLNKSGSEKFRDDRKIVYHGNHLLCYEDEEKGCEIKSFNGQQIHATSWLAYDPYIGYICGDNGLINYEEVKILPYTTVHLFAFYDEMKVRIKVPHNTNVELYKGIYIGDNIYDHETNDDVYEDEKRGWVLKEVKDSLYGVPLHDKSRFTYTKFNVCDNAITSMIIVEDLTAIVWYSGGRVIKPRYTELANTITKHLGKPSRSDFGSMEWKDGNKTVRLHLCVPMGDYPVIELVVGDM